MAEWSKVLLSGGIAISSSNPLKVFQFFMGSLLWNRLPKSIKYSTSFLEFKNRLKKLSTKICFCNICSDYF